VRALRSLYLGTFVAVERAGEEERETASMSCVGVLLARTLSMGQCGSVPVGSVVSIPKNKSCFVCSRARSGVFE
jgi:hypothetical protein